MDSLLDHSLMLNAPLGLIAGAGQFPLELARNAKDLGLEVYAIAHQGETDPAIEQLVVKCVWVKVGQLRKIISYLKSFKCKQAIFLGGISRPKNLSTMRLDLTALLLIAKLINKQDDGLLRGIAGLLESNGIKVLSPTTLLKQSVPKVGLLTKRALNSKERESAQVGWRVAKGLGVYDVGQTVVVHDGVVVALEATEGTDRTILRAGELGGMGNVVVKVSKPNQDMRFDLPSVGLKTIESLITAKATALILEAERCMMLEPTEMVKMADQHKIVIQVVSESAGVLPNALYEAK